MKHLKGRPGVLLVLISMVASACSGAPSGPSASAPAQTPSGATGTPPTSATAAWDAILAEANGQTVNWYMWGGDDTINQFVTGFVTDEAAKLGVTVNQVPITDTVDAVNKVVGEKSAGKDENGSVDMIWINGENFATMKQGDLLHCGWVHDLPNDQYIDWTNPTVNTDFGLAVDECEAPWSLAQMAMIYDSAKIASPPTTVDGLIDWIKANPGRFTYPSIPDFTGSAFVRQILYHVDGGYEDLLGEFDQAKYDAKTPALWALLNELEPSLWREGSTYPQTSTALDQLFANGEVDYSMTYAPTLTGALVEDGTWPETTRQFVFDTGMIGDISYLAIPYNSPNKAGAMVLANVLQSFDAQYNAINTGVGYPALSTDLLPPEEKERFESYPFPPQVAPFSVLFENSNPEIKAKWAIEIEAGWTANVLQK